MIYGINVPIPYAGYARFQMGSIQRVYPIQVEFRNRYGSYIGTIYSGAWRYESSGGTTYDVANVTGEYLGATGGHSESQVTEDKAYNYVHTTYYGQKYALGHLEYRDAYFNQASISAPANPVPYEGVLLDADVHDWQAMPPLTYEWWRNGSILPHTSQTFEYVNGPAGDVSNFHVAIRDSRGATYSAAFTMTPTECADPPCQQ